MKKILILLLVLLTATYLFAADIKITELTEDTSPTSDDLIITVNAPGTSPANRKVTLGNAITKASGLGAGPIIIVGSTMTVATGVSLTELGYLDGVTSAIQTQFSAKAPLTAPTFVTSVALPATLTSAAAVTWTLMDNQASALSLGATGAADILKIVTTDAGPGVTVGGNLSATTYGSNGTVTDAELLYVGDVTSAIQAQLDARCLESVFGTAIGTGLVLDTATLKASTALQAWHGITAPAVAAAGDVIVGSGANAVTVITKGANNTLFGVDNAGVLKFNDTISLGDNVTFFDTDAVTKVFKFDASSITAGQTRVITVADGNMTLQAGTEVVEGVATGGLIFGDSTPDTAGEIAYDGALKFFDASALRTVMTDATGQPLDGTLTALAGLTIQDVSIIEGTGTDAFNVVVSGGNNYFLSSNSGNTALEFKTPAATLSAIGAQAAGSYQTSDATLTALAGLTIADVSIIEGTGTDAFAVVTSGGNNYILGSNSGNTALEFKTPANVLSQIGAQPVDSDLTTIAGLTPIQSKIMIGSATPAWSVSAFTLASPGTSGNILKSDGTNWTSSDTLSIAVLDMTSATSSIPWLVGTASAPTTEGMAYWNSTTDILTVGDGAAAQKLVKGPASVTSNQLTKFSGTTGALVTNSTIVEDATDINAQALNFVTTGIIAGKIGVLVKTANYTLGSGAAREAYGYMVIVKNTTSTVTLPAAVVGMSCGVYSESAVVVRINPDGNDIITLNGTPLAQGHDIYSAGAAGNFICLISDVANKWKTLGSSGVWTDGS
jgi:hypothetical protein